MFVESSVMYAALRSLNLMIMMMMMHEWNEWECYNNLVQPDRSDLISVVHFNIKLDPESLTSYNHVGQALRSS